MQQKTRILFVEDEAALAMIISDSMEAEGFEVHHYSDAEPALKAYFELQPDLIVLDVMLPKSNGFEIAKTIRNTDRKTPIIFLTAKAKVQDVVTGFQSGGNDYLRKPFSIEELIIRMRVLLNDARLLVNDQNEESIFQLGDFNFNTIQQTLKTGEKTIKLTGRESELLHLFCQHQNQLLSKQSILLKIWGDDSFFHSRSMDVFISKLRRYLKEDPRLQIINVRGAGYKLVVA